MKGFVDLHCHWVWRIDDGARTEEEGLLMLRKLKTLGFSHVVATPHMRPGMFDNQAPDLYTAYHSTLPALRDAEGMPETSLGSEHFFDAQVIEQVVAGHGLPYRSEAHPTDPDRMGGALLVEFHDLEGLPLIERQLFELQTKGFIPVIAHPERYRAVWKSTEKVERLVELGSVALLDASSLVGKYGRRAQESAELLLEQGIYDAACTDSHRPQDVDTAGLAIDRIAERYGDDEVELLFGENPRRLLRGERPLQN